MLVTAHTYASSNTWTPQAGLTEGFERRSGNNSNTGQSVTAGYQLMPATGASGAKRSTAGGGADVGNTHILALRPFVANAPPTVSLTSPANGATFNAPASITLTATAADSDGTIQKVEFFHGGTNLIATVTTAPYTLSWTGVPQGSYVLTAVATDNQTATTTSSPVNVTVQAAVAQLYFVEVDHLNTPRLVANAAGTPVWRWDQQEPFGVSPPDTNPSGLGVFEFPLRHPGQYDDPETGLFYNYFRDCYDPVLGRYCQSDPIGLRGGINTYAYVAGDPLRFVDPRGLARFCCRPLDNAFFGGFIGFKHCFIAGDDGTIYTMFSGFAGGTVVGDRRSGPVGSAAVVKDNPQASQSQCFNCPAPCGVDQNQCLVNAYNAYPSTTYSPLSVNCNTFAGTLAQKCCAGGIPSSVPGALGLRLDPNLQ